MESRIPYNPPDCEICGFKHCDDFAHCDTLQYQRWFLDRHGRLPTPEDAMAHCPPEAKEL